MAYSRAWPPPAGEQDQGTRGAVGESPRAHPGAMISFLLLQLLSQLRGCVDYKLFCRGSSSSILSLQHGAGCASELAGTALGQQLLAEIKGIL